MAIINYIYLCVKCWNQFVMNTSKTPCNWRRCVPRIFVLDLQGTATVVHGDYTMTSSMGLLKPTTGCTWQMKNQRRFHSMTTYTMINRGMVTPTSTYNDTYIIYIDNHRYIFILNMFKFLYTINIQPTTTSLTLPRPALGFSFCWSRSTRWSEPGKRCK